MPLRCHPVCRFVQLFVCLNFFLINCGVPGSKAWVWYTSLCPTVPHDMVSVCQEKYTGGRRWEPCPTHLPCPGPSPSGPYVPGDPYLHAQADGVEHDEGKHQVFKVGGGNDVPHLVLIWVFGDVAPQRAGLQGVLHTLALRHNTAGQVSAGGPFLALTPTGTGLREPCTPVSQGQLWPGACG